MPETSAQHGKTFAENIDILFNEIVLATQWGRPSVLLAVNKSKFGQEKAEKALESRLGQQGLEIARITVNGERYDVPALILATDRNPVFFISNLDWGGGADNLQTYRALNLQRESFVESRIKAVFWLTTAELANLARHAPDFWAFRHRVVEFISQRSPASVRLPAGVLLWDAPTSVGILGSPQEGIRAREELLASLPLSPESLSARTELLYSIGYLSWIVGDQEKAAKTLRAGLDLVDGHELPELKSRLLNGAGIARYDAGEYAEALVLFQQGLQLSPASPSLLVNLSAACCMLGRKQEAAGAAKKAIRAGATDAKVWESLGYVHAGMGKPDEAVSHLMKAVELGPRVFRYHAALAVMYGLVDRSDEAMQHLDVARELADPAASAYLDILRDAILRDSGKAKGLMQTSIASGQLSVQDIRRDPNLWFAMEPGQLSEFLA